MYSHWKNSRFIYVTDLLTAEPSKKSWDLTMSWDVLAWHGHVVLLQDKQMWLNYIYWIIERWTGSKGNKVVPPPFVMFIVGAGTDPVSRAVGRGDPGETDSSLTAYCPYYWSVLGIFYYYNMHSFLGILTTNN